MIVKSRRRPRDEITFDDAFRAFVNHAFDESSIPEPTFNFQISKVAIRSGLIEWLGLAP
ncbi:MAG: hypothetical protein BWY82_02971 [Verrucomicrobia bacterium ADurb.Bin474]|nr:MAG: hypothetical protein BWY82_02971 [Verrucomicrobia bacterium ADurb.Bin474]